MSKSTNIECSNGNKAFSPREKLLQAKVDNSNYIGAYIREACNHKLLSHKEEIALAKRIENGDLEAKNELIKCNLSFVIFCVTAFLKKHPNIKRRFEDLIQDGNEGLINAATMGKYDYRKGLRFSSYAGLAINRQIKRGVANNNETIRIPESRQNELNKFNEIRDDLLQALEREPTAEEIAKKLGKEPQFVNKLIKYNNITSLSFSSIANGSEGEDEGEIQIEDLMAPNPQHIAETNSLIDIINDILPTELTDGEGMILFNRFNPNGEIKTYKQIANDLAGNLGKKPGQGRQGIRSLEKIAFSKLRKKMM